MKEFDVIVIGSGPGGYPAAIRAAQHGKKTALIEAKELGGTCLNRGCIPSKALIASGSAWRTVKTSEDFGIHAENISFDYAKMVARKNKVVEKMRKGIEGLLRANKVTLIKGFAKFRSKNEIDVDGDVLKASKIIIATGSEPRNIPAFPFDYEKIHDSTSLLEITKLPKSIVIVGGGVIGCEFASLFNIFGVETTVCELLPSLLPMESKDVSSALTKIFQSEGIKIETGVTVESVKREGEGVEVALSGGKIIRADMALIAVGRAMNTNKIDLEKAGVKTDGKGNIPTNEKMETNVEGIYAIGDIASKWWLAHVATHQGLVAADNACGKRAHIDYTAVPNVIFTNPEVATCGLSFEDAKEKGYDPVKGSYPFSALGKSQAAMHTDGFAQVIMDKNTHQILGAQIVGYEASSLIAEMALAIQNELTIECINETIHAHPTLPEAWLEASLIAFGTPVHMPPKK